MSLEQKQETLRKHLTAMMVPPDRFITPQNRGYSICPWASIGETHILPDTRGKQVTSSDQPKHQNIKILFLL